VTLIPLHPRLFTGESLESWIARFAHSSLEQPAGFSRRYLMKAGTRNPSQPDWDLHYEKFAESIEYYGVLPNQATISKFYRTLGACGGDIRFWTTTRDEGRRFCPECLGIRNPPYFSLIWRMNMMPICLKHRLMLQARCGNPKCNAPVSLTRTNPFLTISRCHRCGFSLKDTPTIEVKKPLWKADPYTRLSGLLYGNLLPEDFGFECDTPEFFRAFRLVLMYVRELEKSGGYIRPVKNRLPVRDVRESLHYIEEAHFRFKDDCFIVGDQAAFNDFMSKRKEVSKVLVRYVRKFEWTRVRVGRSNQFRRVLLPSSDCNQDCNQLDDKALQGVGSASMCETGTRAYPVAQSQEIPRLVTGSRARKTINSAK
jgi:hypothetical protein